MYQCLKQLNNGSFIVHNISGYQPNGDVNRIAEEKTGFIVEMLETIVNAKGEEVQSNTQIYTDLFDVTADATIEYPIGSLPFNIQKLGRYKDALDPSASMLVIYL